MPAVMVQLHGVNHTNLARIVSNHITKGASFQVWVQVPVTPPDTAKYEEGGEDGEEDTTDTWDWWNRFRLVANSNSKINLCLSIVENIPTENQVLRWVGEPMKTVSIPTSMFLTNKKGYPVLGRQHQALIRRFIHLDIQVMKRLDQSS
jgi:protein arginine N-methyltransferase 5